MTFDTSRIEDARIPVTVVELYLDTCAETFGSAPCTASNTTGKECYNTFATCQDTANFNNTSKTYRFYQPVSNWPIGQTGYPCVSKQPKFTPCKIDPKGSLGRRGVVTIELEDFADDDLFTDEYQSTRLYDPETQGTFFRKLKIRSPYYKGRLMKVRQGYINDTFSFNDFQDKLYVIESIDIDHNGLVTITGKDLLKLAEDRKSVAPAASTGTLSTAYTAGGTTLVLQTGDGAAYANDLYTGTAISVSVPGYVRSGDNILKYTGVSTDTLTGVVGGQKGSTDEDLDIDDEIQLCLNYNNVNVVDIIDDLLKTYAGIDEQYIPYDAGLTTPTGTDDVWDVEADTWLSSNDLYHLVTKPTGVTKLIESICEQNLIYIWYDERDQEIKLRAIAPKIKNEVPPTLSDDVHIIKDSVKTKDNDQSRISQIWVYYDQRDITEKADNAENYKKLYIQVDTDSEGDNAYSEKSIRVIYADWLNDTNAGLIITLGGRLLSRYAGTPQIINFKVDKKDADFWAGNVVLLDSFAFQDVDGSNKSKKVQILKVNDDHDSQFLELEAESWDYNVFIYGYIGPDTLLDYTAESAANKAAYGFISGNDGLMSNGDEGYAIV